MNYTVYFDFRQSNINWFSFLPGVVMILCTTALIMYSIKKRSNAIIPTVLLVIEAAFLLFFVSATIDQFRYYNNKYDAMDYSIAEGVVVNHEPVTHGDGGVESFEVNGVRFVYLGKDPPPPYNQTVAKGGKIRNGLQVRITYTSRYGYEPRWAILKIEFGL